MPPAAGAFRGSLALLLATQDHLDEAHALLATGEPLVESHPEEHAKFLCKKAQVQLIAAQSDDARTSLQQAQDLAAELGVNEHSELAKAIAETEALLGESGPEDDGGPDGGEAEPAVGADEGEEEVEEPEDTEEVAPEVLEGERLLALGQIELDECNYPEALLCFVEALEIFRRHDCQRSESFALGSLGITYSEQGQPEKALKYGQLALTLLRKLGNKRTEATVLDNLGIVFLYLGEHEQALKHMQLSLELNQNIGNKSAAGATLINLALLSKSKGDLDTAIE